MLASISLFLAPVLQSLIATAIFESGKEGVSFRAGKKSREGRYRNAFERAITRFYADPEYAGNEARREYDHYLEALKEDFDNQIENYIEDDTNKTSLLQELKGDEFKDYIDDLAEKIEPTVSSACKNYDLKKFESKEKESKSSAS